MSHLNGGFFDMGKVMSVSKVYFLYCLIGL